MAPLPAVRVDEGALPEGGRLVLQDVPRAVAVPVHTQLGALVRAIGALLLVLQFDLQLGPEGGHHLLGRRGRGRRLLPRGRRLLGRRRLRGVGGLHCLTAAVVVVVLLMRR